nr:hypothetical protein [Tanacetum cinerariifolium]
VKSASTPIETEKPLLKDPDGEDVDVHLYSDYARASLDKKSTTGGRKFNFSKYIFDSMVRNVDSPSRKFNFSKYIFDSMVRNVDTLSKFLMYPRFIQVVLDHQVDDMTTHNTRYKSPAHTQKLFANIKRVGKGVEVPITHTQPSTTSASSLTDLQDITPTPYDTPPPYQPPTPHDSPLQDQPTTPYASPMQLLTTLMETCVTLSQRGCIQTRGKIASIDADEGITLVDVETDEEEVAMDAESQGRMNVNAASKGISVVIAHELVSTAEPIVFDDEDITMMMA